MKMEGIRSVASAPKAGIRATCKQRKRGQGYTGGLSGVATPTLKSVRLERVFVMEINSESMSCVFAVSLLFGSYLPLFIGCEAARMWALAL